MSLLLDVPYSEKDEAKKLGARWNPELKKWYVEDKKNYAKFHRWFLKNGTYAIIMCDYFYVIEGIRTCFKCKKKTKVIGFGVENFWEISSMGNEIEADYSKDYIQIIPSFEGIPSKLYAYLKSNYNYYTSYSKTINQYYKANHCSYCKTIQGDFFLFEEVDSPFFVMSKEQAKELTLYKVNLKYDLVTQAEFSMCEMEKELKKYADIKVLEMEFDI